MSNLRLGKISIYRHEILIITFLHMSANDIVKHTAQNALKSSYFNHFMQMACIS